MQCEWLTQIDRAVIEPRIEAADLIVGCSEYITKKIADGYPRFAKRCVTVPNAAGVTGDATTTPEPFHVLFVGRVSPEKGVHDLITAFHDVLKRFPDARLHIVGGIGSAPLEYMVGLSNEPHVTALREFYEGNSAAGKDLYLVHLEKYAGQELGKRILFEGRVEHSKTQAFYKRAAVLVNPSLSESFGMTLVEAMMHRVPVVATRIGGMPYIVDPGRTGLLVPPADPKSLAKAICDILENRDVARQMGEAGRHRAVEKFSWERTTDVLLEHCQRLLN
jgi:glycosyltransferase involved in cell wall biosynthesis